MQRYGDMLGSSRGSRNVTASSLLSSYFNEHVIAYRTYLHSVDRDDIRIHQANRIQLPQLQINKYITRKQTRVLCFHFQIVHHDNSKEHPTVTCGFYHVCDKLSLGIISSQSNISIDRSAASSEHAT
jgi:hypothetical protein